MFAQTLSAATTAATAMFGIEQTAHTEHILDMLAHHKKLDCHTLSSVLCSDQQPQLRRINCDASAGMCGCPKSELHQTGLDV